MPNAPCYCPPGEWSAKPIAPNLAYELLDNAPIGIAVVHNGEPVYASATLLQQFGLGPQDNVEPFLKAQLCSLIESASAQRTEPQTIEALGIRQDSSMFALRATVQRPAGDGGQVWVYVLDLTPANPPLAQTAVLPRNLNCNDCSELNRTALDAVDCGLFTIDRDYRLTFLNRAFSSWCASLGMSDAELLGRCIFDIFPFLDDQSKKEYQQVLQTGSPIVLEEPRLMSTSQRILELRKLPILEQQNVTGVLVIARDVTARHQSEMALRRSEARLRDILRSLQESMVLIIDRKGIMLEAWAPKEINQRYGVEVEKAAGLSVFALMSPEDAAHRMGLIERVFQSGQPVREEYIFSTPGGQFWHDCCVSPMHNEQGTFDAVVVFVRDITSQKRALQALRRDEIRLEALLQLGKRADEPLEELAAYAIQQACLLTDSDYAFLAHFEAEGASPNVYQWSQSAGFRSGQVFSRSEQLPWQAPLEQKKAIRDTEPCAQSRLDCPEAGRTHYHLGVPVFHAEGPSLVLGLTRTTGGFEADDERQLTLFLSSIDDIFKRKQSKERLRKLSGIVEQTSDSVVILDQAGIIEYVNRSFELATGYNRKEVMGEPAWILSGGSKAPGLLRDLYRTIMAGQEFRRVVPNQKKGGELFYEELTVSPLKDSKGQITHFVSTSRDISERLALEERLHQAQKMEAVGQLAGGVAHDFNNLLSVILGYTSVVLDELPSQSPSRPEIEEIRKAAERAASLTRQLLAFSRRQVLKKQRVNLNTLVTNMLRMLGRVIGEDIHLETRLEAESDTTSADPGQLEQVLINLVVNARDAMPGGGQVTIETRTVQVDLEEHLLTKEAQPGRHVCLSVHDTGVGMSAEVKNRLFEPFFTTKPVGKGTGLGLATVYGIVRQHGGWLEVQSEPGRGSSFQVYLPLLEALGRDESLRPIRPGAQFQGHGERVLLVEDEPAVRRLVGQLFRRHGYTVLEAESLGQALQVFEQQGGDFRLVFTDFILPDGTALGLIEQLLGRRPDLEVIFCSGYTDEKLRWEEVAHRGFRFLQKPFSEAELFRTVHEVLQARP